MKHEITGELLAALNEIFANSDSIQSEEDLQLALSQKLEPCQRELLMTFQPPAIPPRRPSEADVAELSQKDPPITLPPEGKDPCVSRARLDLLWNREGQQIPIELKFVDDYKSDVYSYYFLKDLHRLERLESLRDIPSITDFRYSIFVTNQSVYWEGRAPEPEPFWLTDGSTIDAGSWFQYPQPSPRTRWIDYPPFHLVHSYQLQWVNIPNKFRALISKVLHQSSPGENV